MAKESYLGNDFYCDVCAGWGYVPPMTTNKCTNCLGLGIRVVKNESVYSLKLPMWIDFSKREELKSRELMVGLSLLTLIALLVITVFVLIYGIK